MKGPSRGITLALVVSVLLPSPVAFAQDQPVVMLHGLGSNSSGWLETASRLGDRVAMAPRLPELEWRKTYQDQAAALAARPEMSGLPGSTVLVGHSNGGIVARQWSRSHEVGGLVTLGTPHKGAPLMPHFFQWATYHQATPSLLNGILRTFSDWTDWTWVFWYVQNALNYLSDFSIWSVFSLGTTLGLDLALPVSSQMHPYSLFLNDLNASGNISREINNIPGRVGIVSIAHNFYWAGPARAVVPEYADEVATALYGAAFGLLYWGGYILAEADPMDFRATEQGLSLLTLGGHVLGIDPTYCRFVSTPDLSDCLQNDGIVPYTSQEYPGAPNLYVQDGPAHTRERQQSDDALYSALVWFTRVPVRGAVSPVPAPEPSPAPEPVPSPPGEPTDPESGGEPSPDSEPSPGASANALQPGQLLRSGDGLGSSGGDYYLLYQTDGNLVLYDGNWAPMWASNTSGDPGIAVMQGDGNFVLYDARGVPVWASGTDGHPDSLLAVQDDGNVVIYAPDGRAIWATQTSR